MSLNKAHLVLSVRRYCLVYCILPITEFCFHADLVLCSVLVVLAAHKTIALSKNMTERLYAYKSLFSRALDRQCFHTNSTYT